MAGQHPDAGRALRITGETEFDTEVVGEGIVLHPSQSHPEEDACAYTPKHSELLRRAPEQNSHVSTRDPE